MKLFNSKVLDERYEIVHEIKKGGFGIVYYGLDRKLNKPVAIKEIAPDLLEDPKYLDMFQEEALNIAKLSHNNIVHIYELKKTADGRLFIIMEYIDGIDLEKIIRRARKLGYKFPSHLATYIVAEICMALDYAHHRRDAFTNKPLNLVHQDISPSNIMISRYGGIKLIDFGIASVRKHQTKENRDNKLRGKIPYMAPEQLIMGNHPDHRSDLFSLGLVLYETLTGQRLFNSHEEVIAAGRNSKWFKKAVKGKRIASPLEKILAKALEIDLSKRYQSANHMYIDLLQYLISCNETGELMDHLADFVTDIFQNETSSNSNNNNKTDIVEEILEIEEDSQQHVSNRAISEEWQAEMQSNPHESLTLEEPQPSSTQAHGITHAEDFSTIELDDEEEDLKTVIDVLRISARNNKKRIIKTIAGVFTAVILLGVFDTIYGWTQVGTWIFDWLFPPAIEIVTVPPNAQVSLDGKEIKGQTPISIDKISPGVHRLSLSLAGYKPIVKSLFVPREGAVHVQGESENEKNRSYLFRFNTEIEIDSFPPEALVYINGIRFNQKTPCTISWEVGSPLTIEMELEGFERLSGFSLDTKEGYEEVEDHRFWQMSVINEPHIKYAVNGIFRKRVIIESIPDGAEIVTTENNEAIGVTGRDNSILLAAGAQELILRKRNFLPKRLTLNIDQNFDKKITAVLSRKVRFRAFDELNLQGDDINAYLVSLKNRGTNILKGRRTTPFEITLPAYTYTAEFEKKGYQKTQATVGPFVQQVQVEMEPSKAVVEIKVIDGLSSQPIADAEIFYNFTNRPRPYESYFDRTDENGEGFGELMKGDYLFTVKRSGYNSSNKNISAQPGETHKFVFRIYPSN